MDSRTSSVQGFSPYVVPAVSPLSLVRNRDSPLQNKFLTLVLLLLSTAIIYSYSPLASRIVHADVVSLSLEPANLVLNVGQTQQISATAITQAGASVSLSSGTAISAGIYHTCARRVEGTVWCWGNNVYGQLGDGTYTTAMLPVQVSGLTDVIAIATGGFHSCALMSNHTVHCWGANSAGQLGNGTTYNSPEFAEVIGISSAIALAGGGNHSCALLDNGTVRCWGNNAYGQLGNGTNTNSTVPVVVKDLSGAIAIASGNNHTCAITNDGTVKCWGWNSSGQLGNGTKNNALIPVQVSGINQAAKIVAGAFHTCTVLKNNTARCWGSNFSGQLGDGTNNDTTIPVNVMGLYSINAIAVGNSHTCVSLLEGTAHCWGWNMSGQLGNGTYTDAKLPTQVNAINTAMAISTGAYHSCALLADGGVECWGRNEYGELGNGVSEVVTTPLYVLGFNSGVEIKAGGNHSCARRQDDTVHCWGRNEYGQLGNGSTLSSVQPVTVSGLNAVSALASGAFHNCVVMPDGTGRCWGYNALGQLGNGTVINSSLPVPVSGLAGATQIKSGEYHSCALIYNGAIQCWGNNYYGQLGNGATGYATTPVGVYGISEAVEISAGYNHSCALLSNHTVKCWGVNWYGQLGDGTYNNALTAVTVTGINTAVAIAAGSNHSCALLADGKVQCWGVNWYGQLGTGDYINSSIPVTVEGITVGSALTAGSNHTCVLGSSGEVKCWGSNNYGQLGEGTIVNAPRPVTVSNLANAIAISAAMGGNHSCALLTDHSIKCWGYNRYGQLGQETIFYPISARTAGIDEIYALTWMSTDDSIAKVDYYGRVTALSHGASAISASVNGIVASTIVTVNRLPTAQNQTISTDENVSVVFTLSASDADGDSLSYSIISPASHGSVSITGGKASYSPALNYSGLDSFQYEVSDGRGGTASATVSLTINAVNVPPLAVNQNVTTREDVAVAITLTATDANSDSLSYSVTSGPSHGSLSGNAPDLMYTPAPNYFGTDSFVFQVSDGHGGVATAVVTISVTAVNDVPAAASQTLGMAEDGSLNIILTGSDIDDDALIFSIINGPNHGSLAGGAPNLIYTPAPNYFGNDGFNFQISDGHGGEATATVGIVINPVNDGPMIYAVQPQSMEEGAVMNIPVLAYDIDNSTLDMTLAGPEFCTLSHDGKGSANILCTPAYTDAGSYNINIYASDNALTASTIINLQIADVPNGIAMGTNVSVNPIDNSTGSLAPIKLSFEQVISPGLITVSSSASFTPPAGYKTGKSARLYDLSSTAISSGNIIACMTWVEGQFSPDQEPMVKLFEETAGEWQDITNTTPDTLNNTICGRTSHLARLVLLYPNSAPVLGTVNGPADPLLVGTSISIATTFSDVDAEDIHSASVAWGDGSSSQAIVSETVVNGVSSGTLTASHTYTSAGIYTITVSVDDAHGGIGRGVYQYVVIYDPMAGYANGTGLFDSPAGAYSLNPSFKGAVSFDFGARYRSSSTTPNRSTRIASREGGWDFRSSDYQWLVVTATKAVFTGVGQLNGAGDYGFMISAVDGQLIAPSESDRIRLKIWDRVTGAIVYDNEPGAGLDSNPVTPAYGGDIVIYH